MKEPTQRWEAPSGNDLTAHKLAQNKDTMVCITRQIDYVVTDYMIRRSGADLKEQLLENLTEYCAKQYELTLIDIIKAIFGINGTLKATHTKETDSTIDFDTIFAAKALLGDNADELSTSAYHSKVVNQLRTKGMTTDMYTWKEKQVEDGSITKVAGLPIIQTDILPADVFCPTPAPGADKCLSLLMGTNSIYFANPYLDVKTWEYPRRNGGEYHIIVTTDFCVHIPGVKYVLTSQEPTDLQLAAPGTWEKVADHNKDIKLVGMLTLAE
jgi:hypothetical protein